MWQLIKTKQKLILTENRFTGFEKNQLLLSGDFRGIIIFWNAENIVLNILHIFISFYNEINAYFVKSNVEYVHK